MEQRQKLNTECKKTSEGEEELGTLTPKIRQSRVEIDSKKRRNAVDAGTIRRR
jgi:hypothetical protein